MWRFPKNRVPRHLGSLILIVLLVTVTAYAYRSWKRADRIEQPLAFSHRTHAANAQIECAQCHPYFSQGARSGLPDSEVCVACHAEALTQSPEETKLRDSFQRNQPIVFRKLFHLPTHVYYSHRRHVVLGKLECATCHGDIANSESPPLRPLVQVSMDFCVKCHARSNVTNDCKACHR